MITLMRTGHLGSLSFGMGSTLAASFLGPLILHMLKQSPELTLRPIIKTSDRLLKDLMAENIDFFVGDIRVAEHLPDVEAEPLFPCTFGWFCRVDHPLAAEPQVSFSDLTRHPLLIAGFVEESLMKNFARIYDLTLPISDHFNVATDDIATMLTVVAGSDSICTSTDYAMIAAWRDGRILRLPVTPALDMEMTLGIVRRSGRTMPPAADSAFDFIRKHFHAANAALATL